MFYPTYAFTDDAGPFSLMGDDLNPAISMLVYAGDLGLDSGAPQSVYALDKTRRRAGEQARRLDVPPRPAARPGGRAAGQPRLGLLRRRRAVEQGADQPDPGQVARPAAGWCSRCSGLLGSLFIRPRRIWVRARRRRGRHTGRGRGARPLGRRRPPPCSRDRCRTPGASTEGKRRDRHLVGAPQQPGRRRLRGRLLPGPAGHLVEWSCAAQGAPARPASRGRGRAARAASGAAPAPTAGGDASPSAVRPVRPAAHRARAAVHFVALSAEAWPPTPTGCPGATCTSSR